MALPPGFKEVIPEASTAGNPPSGFSEESSGHPIKKAISKYAVHPIIEGGAMGLGGTAGAIVGAPAGPVGSALTGAAAGIAMYPPAHQAANAVDEMMGLPVREPSNLAKDLQAGAEMEAAGQAIPAVAGAVGKIPFAKFGEAFSGTPAKNLTRAFKKGLSTYVAKPIAEASENYGDNESRIMMNSITPEEQASMVADESGFAKGKLKDVLTRWLKGEDVSVKDALQAKHALSVVYPNDTAKKAVLRGKMAQFGDELNGIIAAKDPAMAKANADYADSALRSQLLQPLRVNKTNPNEPSKLGIMLGTDSVVKADNPFEQAIKVFTVQSPAFHGFVSSLSGQIAKMLPNLGPSQQQALAKGLFSAYQNSRKAE